MRRRPIQAANRRASESCPHANGIQGPNSPTGLATQTPRTQNPERCVVRTAGPNPRPKSTATPDAQKRPRYPRSPAVKPITMPWASSMSSGAVENGAPVSSNSDPKCSSCVFLSRRMHTFNHQQLVWGRTVGGETRGAFSFQHSFRHHAGGRWLFMPVADIIRRGAASRISYGAPVRCGSVEHQNSRDYCSPRSTQT